MQAKVREGQKALKCMNHNPENSKWGMYAPEGGCDQIVNVDQRTDKVLCSYCTQRSVNNMRDNQYKQEEE